MDDYRSANSFHPQAPKQRSIDGLTTSGAGTASLPIRYHRLARPLISHEFFKQVLGSVNPVVSSDKPLASRFNRLQYTLFSLAALLLIAGGYISYMGWSSTNNVHNQAANLTALANKMDASGQLAGSTKKPAALSTTPISKSALANYSVAPNLPKYLIIPKLNVDARVLSVGVTSTGALATPNNIYDTAWYNESAQPGQPGAMLIDGHVSSWTSHGVFYGIKSLKPGDIIKLERGDNTVFSYSVIKTQVYPSGEVNMQAAMTPVIANQPGLNLITCTGDVIPGTSQFNERIVVFASLQT